MLENMTTISWGVLGPEQLVSERRTRTLGMGTVVRVFNDLAVPSLGGVKYSKSVFLACLGIYVAEKVRGSGIQVSNIEVSNAIEALACCLSYRKNGWQSDPRLQGNTKLRGKEDLSFKAVSKSNFYVTQPMRMATVQTLPGLDLVAAKGERFNSYSLSVHGVNLVEAGCEGLKCHRNGIVEFLVKWVLGDSRNPNQSSLTQVISQLEDLAKGAKGILKERLVSGNDENSIRRRNALSWVSNISKNPCVDWQQPTELTVKHFKDIQSGAYFFILRDKIMQLLDAVETEMADPKSGTFVLSDKFSTNVVKAISNVKFAADRFITAGYDPSPEQLATSLANECLQTSEGLIIASLVERDNVVLKVRGKAIIQGPAFGGAQAEPSDEHDGESLFPRGISYRLWNLYVLNLDFNDQLDLWLNKKDVT